VHALSLWQGEPRLGLAVPHMAKHKRWLGRMGNDEQAMVLVPPDF
jgi:hypothetical protein